MECPNGGYSGTYGIFKSLSMGKRAIIICVFSVAFFTACQDYIPMVNLGLDDVYAVERMKALVLHPEFPGDRYEWSMTDCYGNDSLVSTERDFVFLSADTGVFDLKLHIEDAQNPVDHEMSITVWEESVAYSRYISKVYEYRPAPGQFVNELPQYQDGDTEESMRQKAEECISGKNDVLVSLGAYGGYITFGFDHTVVNVAGEMDFKILGNAFYAAANPNPGVTSSGGSAEPGIVMVSFDRNGNGIPDDEWYELAGSEYYKDETQHGYMITYYRPSTDHVPVSGENPYITDSTYILWSANDGSVGYIAKNAYHRQDYYPKWFSDDELVFAGTKLANNAIDESGKGTYYVLYAYDWGYVDNHPNEVEDKTSFDIDWAVDAEGNKVHLPGVDFIRVYTAVNQQCGWLGETSTELSRAEDLHVSDSSLSLNP